MSTLARTVALFAAAACAVLACATGAAPASAAGAAAHRCSRHAYGSMKLTPQVVVFAGRNDADAGQKIWACRRPGGAPLLVGLALPDDGEYGSDSTIDDIQVAGTWVLARITRDAAQASSCSKYMLGDPACPVTTTVLHVLDTRSGRAGEVPVVYPTAVALSAAGALAWLDGGVLSASALTPRATHALALAPQELDRGPAITDVRFAGTGRTLQWRNAGAARSQLVPAP